MPNQILLNTKLCYKNRQSVWTRLHILFSALSMFLLISSPSLKLLGVGNAANLMAIICLLINALVSRVRSISSIRRNLIIWLLAIFFILFLFSIPSISEWTGKDLFKFLFLFSVLALLLISYNTYSSSFLIILIASWGAVLSIWQLTLGVPMSREIGQNYLTLSMPIAFSLCLMQGILFFSKSSIWMRLGSGLVLLINLLAMSTIISRSGIIHPALVFISSFLLFIFLSKNIKAYRKFAYILIIVCVVSIGLYYAVNEMDWAAMYRIQHLEDISDQSRTVIYGNSLKYISNSPIVGYGMPMIPILYNGVYPHNIFLEIMVSGGIIPCIVFLVFVIYFFIYYIFCFRVNLKDVSGVALFTGAFFMFLQWNTSFSFLDAYIPISMMMIAMIRFKEATI